MQLRLHRFIETTSETLGKLTLNDKLLCYTLEDAFYEIKIKGITRIKAGSYAIKLRTFGTTHQKYAAGKYGPEIKKMHKGMLWLQNVTAFDGILIHIGNTHADTKGCLLVGTNYIFKNGKYELTESTKAYQKIYPLIAYALSKGEEVTIQILNA